MPLTRAELRAFAETGARVTIARYEAEIAALRAAFPALQTVKERIEKATATLRKKPRRRKLVAPVLPAPKTLHWSQTPAGRKRIARVSRRTWARLTASGRAARVAKALQARQRAINALMS